MQRTAVEWHAFSVKRLPARCKRSLFFDQRTFQALPRLASVRRIWDNNDHGCEGMPRSRTSPRHMTPRPRLRS
jgi:hypothetical protein